MLNTISSDPYVQGVFIAASAIVLIVFRLWKSESNRAAVYGMERLQKEFESLHERVVRQEQKGFHERLLKLEKKIEDC